MNISSYMIYPVHLVYEKFPIPGWEDIRHSQDVHSLYWIVDGEGIFRSDDETLRVQKGDMFYLKPGVQLKMESGIEKPLHIRMLLFDALNLQLKGRNPSYPEALTMLPLPFVQSFPVEQGKLITERLRRIAQVWNSPEPAMQTELQYEVATLLTFLQPNLSHKPDRVSSAYSALKTTIETQFASELKLDDFAHRFGVSLSHLRKRFIKELEMSPKEYLNTIRNSQALKYLTMTSEPMKVIAELCGFADEQHFSKMFRKWNGTSPARYRKQYAQPVGSPKKDPPKKLSR